MSDRKIIVVVPTIRPESHYSFVEAWAPLLEKHKVTLITVWDGDVPQIEVNGKKGCGFDFGMKLSDVHLFCRHTDACRNLGFVVAAQLMTSPDDVCITLDDDVAPRLMNLSIYGGSAETLMSDPIQDHLDALERRVPLGWMNTAHNTDLYLRGVPYGIRNEAPVMLSHGVWVGTPDFDGETQLKLENNIDGVPYWLPYYVGPIPRGGLFPLCGMNVAVKRGALPYLYFAPMGTDSGVPDLHRFADIFMGVFLKREFDRLGWACYTGASTILHTRASDARKNFEQEKLGREWMEHFDCIDPIKGFCNQDQADYFQSYADKRKRYAELIRSQLSQ